MAEDDLEVLSRFVFDNRELERLEALLDEFNPFSAMRWIKQEVRHSSFLRWLLDPAETHGMGAYFLGSFLKHVAYRAEGLHPDAPSVIDVDTWELGRSEVVQEWENIDLFVRNDTIQFVAVIENKVESTEHSSQLQRYRSLVEQQFPGHKKFYVYLTVEGEPPSDDLFVPVSYAEIVELVRAAIERRRDQLSGEVRTFLVQYVELIRRHIVEDSEVQEVCRRIYEKHQRALDVLFEHRPDRASEISAILRELISNHKELLEDHCTKAYVRFIPKELDFLPKVGQGWTPSNRVVLVEIQNYQSKLSLKWILGPGSDDVRQRIHDAVEKHPKLFNRANGRFSAKWWSFHTETWLGKKRFEENSLPDLEAELAVKLSALVKEKLPLVVEALESLRGLSDHSKQ